MSAKRLLIDIGNTTLSYCSETDLEKGQINSVQHGKYDLEMLLNNAAKSEKIDELLLASVYDAELTNAIQNWCETQGILCKIAQSQPQKHGLKNGYIDPVQLGVDRWLSMLGIWAEIRSAFFLVTCGTALTFDQVNDHGEHQGGVIIPGFQMMQSCLKKGTVGIDNTDKKNDAFWGLAQNTQDAITNGSLMAICSVIENLIDDAGMDVSQGYISGGDAKLINAFRQKPLKRIKNAVLTGLSFDNEALPR